jgi:hypothetical protein
MGLFKTDEEKRKDKEAQSLELLRQTAEHLTGDLDEKSKAALDHAVKVTITAMHDTFPELGDSALSKISSSIAYIVASLAQMPIRECSSSLVELFMSYSVCSAALAGVYEPDVVSEHTETPKPEKPSASDVEIEAIINRQYM